MLESKQKDLQQRQKMYEKNMKVLIEKYPEIADKINCVKSTNSYVIKSTGERKLPNIYMNKHKSYYYDKKDPMVEVTRYMDALKLPKTNIALFLGFGLGYEVLFYGNVLSEKLETKYVIIIEQSVELFKNALKWIDIGIILKNDQVLFIIGEEDIQKKIEIYLQDENKLNCLKNVSAIYYPSAFKLNKDYYMKAFEMFNLAGKKLLDKKLTKDNLFEKNLSVLRKNNPDLAMKVEKCKETGKYKIVNTGEKNIPNLWMEEKKIFYYDFENPMQDAEQQIEHLKLRNTRVALFLGCGLGYELDVFKNKIANTQNTIGVIIVEKELEIFKLAMEITDFTEFFNKSKIKLLIASEMDEFFLELQNFFGKHIDILWAIKTLKPIYHPSAIMLNKEYYLQTIREIKNIVNLIITYYGNDPEDSLIGVRNMLLNINEIIRNPGINLLYDKFKGKPAIIVSTGPSLNKNKHLLKGLENKAVIICPDASLKILMDMGVKPHLVTSLERIPGVVDLLEGFNQEDTEDVYFAGCPVVVNECYKVHKGPKIIVYRKFDHFKWIEIERGMLDIKQSSGNMAFKVAQALGCEPIILIGQDLAYSEDGKTHASGTHYGDNQESESKFGDIEVIGNDGNPIRTNNIWYSFLKSYELDIVDYGGLCVNSTEGGAYIKGTEVMPFKEAIEKYIQEDIYPLEIIKRNAVLPVESFKGEIERVVEIIDNTDDCMTNIIKTCDEGIVFLDRYEDKLNLYINNENDLTNSDIETINRIDNEMNLIKKDLNKEKEIFQLFFMHIVQPYLIKFEIEMLAIPDYCASIHIAKVKILLEQKRLFVTVRGIAEICKKMLIEAKENIEKENMN